jgi:hypothetical protein
MHAAFAEPQNDDERKIKALIDEYNAQQAGELEQELFKQRRRLADAERTLEGAVWSAAEYASVHGTGEGLRCQEPVPVAVGGHRVHYECSHAASVLPADFKQGVGDLSERAAAHGFHQHLEHIGVGDHRVL